ncbi:MAG: hypothetical protein VKK62_11440 [Synechococcaceae cyanobacterium]|nr:hypothetical protein [Synechococcaceae cyanobacterium]
MPPLRLLKAAVLGLCLAIGLAWLAVTGPASALSWPAPRTSSTSDPATGDGAATGWREVPPPVGVQQLQELLSLRQPRLAILSPGDGSLLPPGPWTLKLAVEDWPLQPSGALGPGPHLVLQLDDEAPQPLDGDSVELPELSPGSHRLSVYAAMPWGEAVRQPGALAQIQLHRLAANPLSLPGPGSPQLLAVPAVAAVRDHPVLLDWLLLNAPLQNLRADDSRWRLRLCIDGDSLLLDRQEALWIEGLSPGSHTLQLSLLDPVGEPINPPFNSLVRELRVSDTDSAPLWLQGPLAPLDLAVLSGSAPAESAGAPAPAPPPSLPQQPLPPAGPEPAPPDAPLLAQEAAADATPAEARAAPSPQTQTQTQSQSQTEAEAEAEVGTAPPGESVTESEGLPDPAGDSRVSLPMPAPLAATPQSAPPAAVPPGAGPALESGGSRPADPSPPAAAPAAPGPEPAPAPAAPSAATFATSGNAPAASAEAQAGEQTAAPDRHNEAETGRITAAPADDATAAPLASSSSLEPVTEEPGDDPVPPEGASSPRSLGADGGDSPLNPRPADQDAFDPWAPLPPSSSNEAPPSSPRMERMADRLASGLSRLRHRLGA